MLPIHPPHAALVAESQGGCASFCPLSPFTPLEERDGLSTAPSALAETGIAELSSSKEGRKASESLRNASHSTRSAMFDDLRQFGDLRIPPLGP